MTTNYQTMQNAKETMYEIEKSTTPIAMEFKQKIAAKQDELQHNQSLSGTGREQKLNEYRATLGKEFIAKAKEMREQYDRAAISAKVAAEVELNDGATKPSDIAIATFQRELTDVQTSLMLATNAKTAMSDLDSFVDKQTEPYFSQQIRAQLPSFAREILALAGVEAPQYKQRLAKTVERLDGNALNSRQREAKEYLDAPSRYGADLWRMGTVQLSAIEQAIGKQYTRYANNPADFTE